MLFTLIVHSNSRCDECKQFPIIGKRYRCNSCNDFDYCETCYFKNKMNHNHMFTLMSGNSGNINVHKNIKCDGCGKFEFSGSRFKCQTCHNLDYCESCYKKNLNVHTHAFMQFDV